MNKVLTIIIPTYNMEKYLRHCLSSLIVPSMDKVEVLVINDGSKDASSAIAHEYQDKYPRTFRVIDKDNGNYGSCINRGLKEATGEYVKVLDADDSFDNHSFEVYVNTISRINVDLILNDTNVVNENGKTIEYRHVYNATPGNIIDFNKCPLYTSMHGVAYKLSNLIDIKYKQTEGISHTDEEWIFYPMSTVQTAYYLDIPLYQYLLGRQGQTMDANVFKKTLPQRFKVLDEMISIWEEHYEDWIKTHMSKRIFSVMYSIFYESIIHGDTEQKSSYIRFDSYIKSKYPIFYAYSNKAILGMKVPFHYMKYWRYTHTLFPFNFLFSLKEKYGQYKMKKAMKTYADCQ